jgi:cystathionine beta-lyase/cystathionine gamma-synthase
VSNPTVSELEERLGALESAPPAVCFASGLAAETAVILALCKAGDRIVCSASAYGGTIRLLSDVCSRFGIDGLFVDSTKPQAVADAINSSTTLVFIETPANPTLALTDIAAIATVCTSRNVPLAVDNTFLTPILQQPLGLGADLTVSSTTKLIDGHSAATGGSVVSRNEAILNRVRFIRKSTGGIQTPFGAFQTLQGLKTLPLRAKAQSDSALVIAEALVAHNGIEAVHYPGLVDSEHYALACTQHLRHHGNVVSFEVAGGRASAECVVQALRVCRLVEHVGSVETLVTHSASMTHADCSAEHLESIGVGQGLIRLSVGLEEPHVILNDLQQALASAIEVPQSAAGGQNEVHECPALV